MQQLLEFIFRVYRLIGCSPWDNDLKWCAKCENDKMFWARAENAVFDKLVNFVENR